VIEAEVHLSLHNFLRSQAGFPNWHHHLTMARLVARALRVGRSALIQVGAACGYQGRYRTSFVAPALMWHGPVVIVAPETVQQRLLKIEIPRLQEWLKISKPIFIGDKFPNKEFQGLFITTPQAWLKSHFVEYEVIPQGIPTIIDGVDDLEDWVRASLTVTINPSDWEELMLACPSYSEEIREARVHLTREFFQHPPNPYECYSISQTEQDILTGIYDIIGLKHLPSNWQAFYQQFQYLFPNTFPNTIFSSSPPCLWATINRRQGLFSLNSAPIELSKILTPIWQRQPVVLVGSALEAETQAPLFRQRLGLGEDITPLKFSSDNQTEAIQLYAPHNLPLPNTPQFQNAFINKVCALVCLSATTSGLIVIIVGDVPLKAQVGTILASEFGSRVQVEKTCLEEHGILITGWEYWRENQAVLPSPKLLIIATLPFPSLEHPLVSLLVTHYKRSHQDWFRLYLLPIALNELQRAIAPARESQGIVALLDGRVVNRSYGAQILSALSPLARINYLEPGTFSNS
jgi:ATP-dependent DNA helicase DinG